MQSQPKANRLLGRLCQGLGHELVGTRLWECPWLKEQEEQLEKLKEIFKKETVELGLIFTATIMDLVYTCQQHYKVVPYV